MTLSQIQAKVYSRCSLPSVPDAVVVSRILGFINDEYRTLMRKRQMARFRRVVGLPVSSTANNPYMAMPYVCRHIYAIQDRTNQRNLDEYSLMDLRNLDPALIYISSFPYAYAIVNYNSPVFLQPPITGDKLFIKSDNVGDVGVGFIEGIVVGGFPTQQTFTMNGTTAVQLPLLASWIEVQKLYLVTAAIGNVSLVQTSGVGTTLSTISSGQTSARYTVVQLYPEPSGVVTYFLDAEIAIFDLANATDEPLFFEDFHDILVDGALMREYEKREKPVLYAQAKSRRKDVQDDLFLYLARNKARRNLGQMGRWSQLGPYFPPGT
jgi:hypothetical protein